MGIMWYIILIAIIIIISVVVVILIRHYKKKHKNEKRCRKSRGRESRRRRRIRVVDEDEDEIVEDEGDGEDGGDGEVGEIEDEGVAELDNPEDVYNEEMQEGGEIITSGIDIGDIMKNASGRKSDTFGRIRTEPEQNKDELIAPAFVIPDIDAVRDNDARMPIKVSKDTIQTSDNTIATKLPGLENVMVIPGKLTNKQNITNIAPPGIMKVYNKDEEYLRKTSEPARFK